MTDDQPTSGSCVCCHKRDARQGYACDADRSKLRGWLGEIPDLWQQLLEPEPVVREYRGSRLLDDGTEVPHYDHVANVLPTGGGSIATKGGPVSGSRERQLPIRTDLFDLTHFGAGERIEGEDQVGHLAVWMTLESWMADWADWRGRGEVGVSGITEMCEWLRVRVDDACDAHPAIDECFEDIRQLRGAMMAQLGRVDIPDYKRGVPCRNSACNALALVHHAGSEWIECGECSSLLSFDDYDRWTRLVAAAAKKMERAA